MKGVTLLAGLALCIGSGTNAQLPDQRPICIKPADIERIEILKGARAVQEYGLKEGEGVIVIAAKISSLGNTLRDCSTTTGDDPLARSFFPPELVMGNQQAIELSDRQRSAIQAAMKLAQSGFVDAQFKMSAEVERLKRLVDASPADQAAVLEQIDRVLSLEREVKRAQIGLMLSIKNQLTEEQKAALAKLRGDQEAELAKTRGDKAAEPVSPRGRGRPE